jgi:hypothetical protein
VDLSYQPEIYFKAVLWRLSANDGKDEHAQGDGHTQK